MINKVYKNGRLSAIFINFLSEISSTTFCTDDAIPLQVGVIVKDPSRPVLAHRHNIFERKVMGTSEFLFVLKGSMKVTIFDDDFLNPEEYSVNEGMGILLLSGAHSIDFNATTQLIEVKQGPYSAEVDKVYRSEFEK